VGVFKPGRYVRDRKIQALIDSGQVENILLAIELDAELKRRVLQLAKYENASDHCREQFVIENSLCILLWGSPYWVSNRYIADWNEKKFFSFQRCPENDLWLTVSVIDNIKHSYDVA